MDLQLPRSLFQRDGNLRNTAGALHSGFPHGKTLKNSHGKILHRKTPDLVGRTMAFPLISPKPSEKMLDFHRIN